MLLRGLQEAALAAREGQARDDGPGLHEGDIQVGRQTRVDLATLAFFLCFVGFFGPVNDVNLIKAL